MRLLRNNKAKMEVSMAITTNTAPGVEIALNRLRNEYGTLGSYDRLADKYEVNVRYVWDFICNGVVPKSKSVCRKLRIPVPPSPALQATRRRIAQSNAVARIMGFKNWSEYTTCMIELFEGETL